MVELVENSKPLIVTHWDMDGVASATVAAWIANGFQGVYVPRFTFTLPGSVLEEIATRASSATATVLTDLGYSYTKLEKIASHLGSKKLVVIDHHTQVGGEPSGKYCYYNPAATGDPEGKWPSAAHVAAELKPEKLRDPLLVAASILGDLGKRAYEHPVFQAYIQASGVEPSKAYELIERCKSLIDAASAMACKECLEQAVMKAYEAGAAENKAGASCKAIIGYTVLAELEREALEERERLLQEARSTCRELNHYIYCKLQGRGRHASKIARELSREYFARIVVVEYTSTNLGRTTVYVRGHGLDTRARKCFEKLFYTARSLLENDDAGISAGGKLQEGNTVLAVEAPIELGSKVADTVKALLEHYCSRTIAPRGGAV